MKNPLNPTKDQIKYRNRLWAEALIENKRKARSCMKDKAGGRCCLRVAEDLALEMLPAEYTESYERDNEFPGDIVCDFFGWEPNNVSCAPELRLPKADGDFDSGWLELPASDINDNDSNELGSKFRKGLPHSKIAECVMNTFVHPKKVKWTFEL